MPNFLTVQFAFNGELKEGDKITFLFGQFSGTSEPVISSGKFLGSWDATTTTLVLKVKDAQTVAPDYVSQVVISKAVQIRIPTGGHPKDTPTITISCEAVAGNVQAVPIQSSPPVAVFTDTSLSFNPPTAGRASEITIAFTFLVIGMQAEDTVTVSLPGFSGSAAQLSAAGGRDGHKFSGMWSGPSTGTGGDTSNLLLTVKEGKTIAAYSTVVLVIPVETQIALPASGLAKNEPTLQIRAKAGGSEINPSPIEKTPAVGAFSSSQLILRSLLAGVVTQIEARFQLTVTLQAGEKVELTLAGFKGGPPGSSPTDLAEITADMLGGANGKGFTGTWNASSAKVVLVMKPLTAAIAAGSPVIVTISEGAGIKTPYDGIKAQPYTIMIGTNAVLGPVDPAVPVALFSEIAPGLADVGVYAAIDGTSYALMGVNLKLDQRPSFIDIDDDGDLDLFLASTSMHRADYFENLGSNQLAARKNSKNPLYGIALGNGPVALGWIDVDTDDDFDLFVVSLSAPNGTIGLGNGGVDNTGIEYYQTRFFKNDGTKKIANFVSSAIPSNVNIYYYYENVLYKIDPAKALD